MNVHIPTFEEIHRIAYLTLHGWALDHDGMWFKAGFVRPEIEYFPANPYEGNKPDQWYLDDAYWEQRERAEPKVTDGKGEPTP